ncbi:ArsC-like thioredoxin [Sulfurospirillum multivorans DSM 12446]|uniref:ArsC-like thioredoxin n=4 Tax=Sulfurospirillaceae TaxID=2932623 RepID=A0A1D7THL7_9BACT|nr:ArsC-like thioredoxin [Sulfurospirillum multivorans DSM 12446]AOO64491.1 ArsC-like thioredoxin [Sulfurospirillum halorespirans DSM 13726]QEH05487.1 ArsC-like thioredoxin [Sulfurospirillum multivorans]
MFKTTPNQVIFYEKTGCSGNARQKALLKEHGVIFEVRSLLDTRWDVQTLNAFFEGLSLKEMLNPFAPQLKDGTFKVDDYTKESLIEKMVQEPILIRRPLMQIGTVKLCGFDIPKLNSLLHVKMPIPQNINACLSSDACNNA